MFDFTRERARELSQTRTSLRGDALLRVVAERLKLKDRPAAPPDYTIWRELKSRGYPFPAVAHAIETEPGVQAIVYRFNREGWAARPPRSGPRALLYVSHQSSDQEVRDEPLLRELMEQDAGAALFTCDVRGIGDSWPLTVRGASYDERYGVDYFYATQSLMLDRPLPGQRTFDVLRVLDWLKSFGHSDVHLVARGWGAIPATFAALFADTVQQVTLKNALTTYSDVAETEDYRWPLSAMVPHVLADFDLPDCYAELKQKKLRQIDPCNGAGEVVNQNAA